VIFYKGNYVPAWKGLLRSLTPGEKDRPGVFETFPVYARKPFAFDAHMDRMKRGLTVYGCKEHISRQRTHAIVQALLKKNHLRDARVRVSVVLDEEVPWLAVVCAPLATDLAQKRDAGYHVLLSDRVHPVSKRSNVKSLEYSLFLKTYEHAVSQGYDEALLLNQRQQLTEGTRSNLFCACAGVLYTTPVSSGCLNGITRRIVLRLAQRLQIPVRIKPLSLDELQASSEAFVTNAIIGLMPIRSVNHQTFFKIEHRKIMGAVFKQYKQEVCSQ
jgi:branched-subunit amino acid aminotransferase/4-amino-4-deoxychorismate lyase